MREPDPHSEFETDPLWEVLGRAAPVEVSPFFARNVVRAVRLSESKEAVPGFFGRWRIATLSAVALVVTGIFCVALQQFGVAHSSTYGLKPGDVEVVRHLDELLTYEETNLWLEPPHL